MFLELWLRELHVLAPGGVQMRTRTGIAVLHLPRLQNTPQRGVNSRKSCLHRMDISLRD